MQRGDSRVRGLAVVASMAFDDSEIKARVGRRIVGRVGKLLAFSATGIDHLLITETLHPRKATLMNVVLHDEDYVQMERKQTNRRSRRRRS